MPSHPAGVGDFWRLVHLVEDMAAYLDDAKFCNRVIVAHARTIAHRRILEESDDLDTALQRLHIQLDAVRSLSGRLADEHGNRRRD